MTLTSQSPLAAESGVSASGGPEVGVGVVDSRLLPLTKPPNQHTTLGPQDLSVPEATNWAQRWYRCWAPVWPTYPPVPIIGIQGWETGADTRMISE